MSISESQSQKDNSKALKTIKVESNAPQTDLDGDENEPVREKSFSLSQINLISSGILSRESTIPANIITFEHTFGYNCKKLYNLCLIDPNTLIFVSGNLIHFYDLRTNIVKTRRCSTGQGIGCITKNPNPKYGYLTVAENGTWPPVIIYRYPEMEVVSYLRKGTQNIYSHVAYSPDGELLVTQGGEPDYLITIWNWQKIQVILRTKSFSNDILTVMFSPYVDGQLTTGGLSHIKFWKMAETFTGLKLKGDLGRFGKTEICDVLGLYPMPDEKVLSGCDWGNILVWDEGLIKYEVCRKSRKKLHNNMITQISLSDETNNEVMTASLDGYVRIWFWTTVENADPPDDDRFVEIEPIYEFKIGTKTHTCEIVWMVKMDPANPEDYKWYIQDGNGGIWLTDLSPDYTPKPPHQIFRCHAGPIVDMATSPFSTHVVTLGMDGRLHVYNYFTKKFLYFRQFPAEGRALKWLSPNIEPSAVVIVMGFGDGVLRVVVVDLVNYEDNNDPITLVQVLKSHSGPITKISVNRTQTILVTGSEDKTIFIHQLAQMEPIVKLIPIGLIELPAPCTAFNWVPNSSSRILLGCADGTVLEAELPERERSYTTISFNLSHIEPRTLKFKSVKSELRRQLQIKCIEERKENKRGKKMASLTKLRRENPGLEIDENTFLEDSESDEELEPLFVPKIPNSILWIQSTPQHTVWLCMSGYDAGYIYEYEFDNVEPVRCTLIPGADDLEIHSYLYTDLFLILGLDNGNIRISGIKPDFTDLTDCFTLSMHDNINGRISQLAFSYDNKYLFSVGHDGNLFSYKWNAEIDETFAYEPNELDGIQKVDDIEDPNYLSLEQQKQKDDFDKRMKIAKERKGKVLNILEEYKGDFSDIHRENKRLIQSQQVSEKEMELDSRITRDLETTLEEELNLVRTKLAFDVEKSILANRKIKDFFIDPLSQFPFEVHGIVQKQSVRIFRCKKLTGMYYKSRADLEDRLKLEMSRKRVLEYVKDQELREGEIKVRKLESFLQGLTGSTIEFKLEYKLKRLLDKYRARKDQEVKRKTERDYITAIKPDVSVNHPDDVRELIEAERTIGDYKLKIDPTYVADEETSNTLRKYQEVLGIIEEIYRIKTDFNAKVTELRRKKADLVRFHRDAMIKLTKIHEEIPIDERKFPLQTPKLNLELEFPELHLFDPAQVDHLYGEELIIIDPHTAENLRIEEVEIDILGLKEYAAFNSNSESIFQEGVDLIDFKHIEPATEFHLTAMEKERRCFRLTMLEFEQDRILYSITKRVKVFDDALLALKEERLRHELDSKYMTCHLLTLNQELLVLRDFERLEYKLVETRDQFVVKRNTIQVKIIDYKNAIDQNRRNIEAYLEEGRRIESKFIANCSANKFFDFLRRIFKKKFKPPKLYQDEDSTSSSSDSSSDDDGAEEGASVDSMEIGPIRLDENVCPPGCDRMLYDLTFILRDQRHEIEQKVKEEQKVVDQNKREIDMREKTKKSVDVDLEKCKTELVEFRREKQKMLNAIDTLIVLAMGQIQYFNNEEELLIVKDALLFNSNNITKLYARVQQLEHETIEARRKHRVNVIHLSRMKTDCKFMEKQIIELKEKIQETLIKKFGRIVNLDELEEQVLSRMVYDMKANTDDITREYAGLLTEEKKRTASLQTEYNRALQEGTEKLNILTVLHEERNYLQDMLLQQYRLQHRPTTEYADYSRDINRLKDISLQQQEQILILQREIQTLSLKSKPFEMANTQDYLYQPIIEPPPGYGNKAYQESIYAAVAETLSQASSPRNYDLLSDVIKLVNKFLNRHFGKILTENEIAKREFNLGKMLTNAALDYDERKRDECFQNTIQQFKNYSSKEIRSLLKDEELFNLFIDVLGKCRKFEIEVVDAKEVVTAIIDQATEGPSKSDQLNFTYNTVLEVLKQMMLLLPIGDLKNDENLDIVITDLAQLADINPRCINVLLMIEELMAHVVENLLDDIDLELTKHLVNTVRDGIANKRK